MAHDTLLKLGTRRSPLAMAQAEEARDRLCAAHDWDVGQVELVPVIASGDRIQDRPLADIGGKALWTRELDAWLATGRIDAAVHSMKDVETLRPDTLAIAAILPRADVRDVLVGADSLGAMPQGARIGTSAPRRAAQMLHHRPDCRIVGMRGNVATRLGKLAAGDADVTLLAAAGLARLGQGDVGTVLDTDAFLPAPAQGAIGIECRADDRRAREWLAAIDHEPSRTTVMAERAVLAGLGGTCHSPIAMLSVWEGDTLRLHVSLFSADGAQRVDGVWRGEAGNIAGCTAFARALLRDAPEAVATLFSAEP
ncbi:MAG: hydroxymethylbilane synthase [Parerythrobacter sp.]